MSYEYSKAVYWSVRDTSSTEQSVLAALAFCHNHKTGRCDPSASTLSDMTHFGRASVNRALASLREKNRISWIPGGKGKKGEANSNKYTLYLSDTSSHGDTPPVSERYTPCPTVIHSLSQSETQKRIEEKETNPNPTKELAGLLGDSFVEAAKPRRPEEPSDAPAAIGAFEEFLAAYPEVLPQTRRAAVSKRKAPTDLRCDAP